MNFRLLTAKEYPRWYHDQLSGGFCPQERKPSARYSPSAGGRTLTGVGLFDEDELLSYAAL